MASYKDPTFQDRTAMAQQAREKALKQLAAKPPADPAIVAQRLAVQQAREAAEIAKREAKKAAIAQAKADKIAADEAAAEAARIKLPTAAELKEARDARYAARKKRKG